jgi:2-methylcitrate dehydratase PrpD
MLGFMFRIYPCPGYNQPVIELMGELCQRHAIAADDIAQVRVHMNTIETRYPSPAFPRHEDWQQPRVWDSTHYFAARVAVAGGFPVANGLPPGAPDSDPSRETQARELMGRVRLVPEELRPMFSPAIAIELKNGQVHQGDYPYARMVWDLRTLRRRLQACEPGIEGGAARLDALTHMLSEAHQLESMQPLLALMKSWPA